MVMTRILKYIETHISEPLTIKQLAQIAGYSEYHFIRLFKEYTNMSCMHYIRKRRLIKASEDIVNGNRIIDVAFQYGWQSHSAFTKSFKREFGFSPSLLRTMCMEINCLGDNYMNGIFMKQTKIGETKEQLLEKLKISIRENGIIIKEEQLLNVYQCACRVYADVKRYSGEEYVTHTLNVSILLSEMGAEPSVVLSGMLCDSAKKGIKDFSVCREQLPSEVFDIVSDLEIKNEDLKNASEEVVQIKLAERLHNMRTIEYISAAKKDLKVKETIEIFMPLAKKLNNIKLIDELNDLLLK